MSEQLVRHRWMSPNFHTFFMHLIFVIFSIICDFLGSMTNASEAHDLQALVYLVLLTLVLCWDGSCWIFCFYSSCQENKFPFCYFDLGPESWRISMINFQSTIWSVFWARTCVLSLIKVSALSICSSFSLHEENFAFLFRVWKITNKRVIPRFTWRWFAFIVDRGYSRDNNCN